MYLLLACLNDSVLIMHHTFQPMMTPSAIEEFLPATVDVCRDFAQMVGDKLERDALESSDFLEELKKYFLEVQSLVCKPELNVGS